MANFSPAYFPVFRAFDANGNPLAGGKLYSYAAGTTTPLATYTDATGGTPNTNPVELDANGEAPVWLGQDAYKFILKDADDATIWTADGIKSVDELAKSYADALEADLASTSDPAKGAALVGWKPSGTGGVARNQASKNEDFIAPEDYGADPTGATACHLALQAAIDAARAAGKTLFGRGTYKIEGDVTARLVSVDLSSAVIVINNPTSILTIGGNSNTTTTPRQAIGHVYRATPSSTVPSVRVRGTKCGVFDIQKCDYLEIYADTSTSGGGVSSDGSVAYCDFRLGFINRLDIMGNKLTDGSTTQWINENKISLARCKVLTFDGTYHHNHNIITGGTFEGEDSYINFNVGADNKIKGIRLEGSASAWGTGRSYIAGDRVSNGGYLYRCQVDHSSGTFSTDLSDGKWQLVYVIGFLSGTRNNEVTCSWTSSATTIWGTPGFGLKRLYILDSGEGNHVKQDKTTTYHWTVVSEAGIEDEFPNTLVAGQPMHGRTMTLQKIRGASGAAFAFSDYVPVMVGDIFRWNMFDSAGRYDVDTCDYYRQRIMFFGAKMQPITASADFITVIQGSFATVSGNMMAASSDQYSGSLRILQGAIDAGVRYVRVLSIASGATSANTDCVRMEIARGRSLGLVSLGAGAAFPTRRGDVLLVSGIPTQGFCKAGKMVVKSDGTARWVNVFASEALTAGAEAGSSTVIELATGGGTGTANADVVGINLDDGTTHWTTIARGGGTDTITLAAGIPSNAGAGSRVVFQRWVAA
jgi:hypothetical protein